MRLLTLVHMVLLFSFAATQTDVPDVFHRFWA